MNIKAKKIGMLILVFSLVFTAIFPLMSQQGEALDISFVVYGYIDQSNGSDVPLDTVVTITDTTTDSSDTTTTYENSGDTGYYQYDLKSLSSCSDGDNIRVNCSYNGESGSETYTLDTTDPSKNMSFHLSNLVTHTYGYFNTSVNITAPYTAPTSEYQYGFFNTSVNITEDKYGDTPVLFSPSPANGSKNVSIMPELSIKIYDANSSTVTVTFYKYYEYTGPTEPISVKDVELGPDNVATASATWTDVTSSDTEYKWYVHAYNGSRHAYYPSPGGYLNFTTGSYSPPVIQFNVRNHSNPAAGIQNVNISCEETHNTVQTGIYGNATMSFPLSGGHIGQKYHFHFRHPDYKNLDETFTVPLPSSTKSKRVEMIPKAKEYEPGEGEETDIGKWFKDKIQNLSWFWGLFWALIFTTVAVITTAAASSLSNSQLGPMPSIIIGILCLIIFAAIGLLPWWIIIVLILVAAFGGFMLAKQAGLPGLGGG